MRVLNGAIAALGVLGASQALADPVIYASVPDLTATYSSAWCSDCYGGNNYEPLDQFTLTSAASITSLDLAQQSGYSSANFTFEIYNSDHSAILFSQELNATDILDVNNTSVFHATVTGLDLAAGTYWAGFIAPYMGLPGLPGGNGSLIDTTPHTGTNLFGLGGNTGYIFYGASSPAPEPASWAMMLGGFGLVGGAMRSRKRTVRFA